MFINHTNHPSINWTEKQTAEARRIGTDILDIPFPEISPFWSDEELSREVEKNLTHIANLQPAAVLCQGEFVYSYRMIQCLKEKGIPVYAACSQRKVVEQIEPDGSTKKESIFEFVCFRPY